MCGINAAGRASLAHHKRLQHVFGLKNAQGEYYATKQATTSSKSVDVEEEQQQPKLNASAAQQRVYKVSR